MQRFDMTEEMNAKAAAFADFLLNGPIEEFAGQIRDEYGRGTAICMMHNVLVSSIGKLLDAETRVATGSQDLKQILALANQIGALINDYRYKLKCHSAGELN